MISPHGTKRWFINISIYLSFRVQVDKEWNTKVADFGLSKATSGQSMNSRMGSLNWYVTCPRLIGMRSVVCLCVWVCECASAKFLRVCVCLWFVCFWIICVLFVFLIYQCGGGLACAGVVCALVWVWCARACVFCMCKRVRVLAIVSDCVHVRACESALYIAFVLCKWNKKKNKKTKKKKHARTHTHANALRNEYTPQHMHKHKT